jgi:hypothetical protein
MHNINSFSHAWLNSPCHMHDLILHALMHAICYLVIMPSCIPYDIFIFAFMHNPIMSWFIYTCSYAWFIYNMLSCMIQLQHALCIIQPYVFLCMKHVIGDSIFHTSTHKLDTCKNLFIFTYMIHSFQSIHSRYILYIHDILYKIIILYKHLQWSCQSHQSCHIHFT